MEQRENAKEQIITNNIFDILGVDDYTLLSAYKESLMFAPGEMTPKLNEVVDQLLPAPDVAYRRSLTVYYRALDIIKDEMARRYFKMAQELGVNLDEE